MSSQARIALCLLAVFVATASFADDPAWQDGEDDEVILVPDELVVLLKPEASATAQFVAASVNLQSAVPLGLDVGAPLKARVPSRVPGDRLGAWIAENPHSSEARALRYLILQYPKGSDLESLEFALSKNPNIESVYRNAYLTLAAAPANDPHLGQDTQWGFYALQFTNPPTTPPPPDLPDEPGGWHLYTGHAYLGFIDMGLETNHYDIRPSHASGGTTVFDGGPFRPHLSKDIVNPNCSVDEADPQDTVFDPTPGHGSHVTGVAAATTNNELGVAGACWDCSVLAVKAFPATSGSTDDQAEFDAASEALELLVARGSQVVNMSFGINHHFVFCGGSGGPVNPALLCLQLTIANKRDVVMPAASGNKRIDVIDFPANDARTIAVGGLELDPMVGVQIWDDESCGGTHGCGSQWGPEQDIMAPAAGVITTAYTGENHTSACGDHLYDDDGPNGGVGICTGTSLSAPFITGLAGILRSVNPLLNKEDVKDAITSTASIPGSKDPVLGHGTPSALAAVGRSQGRVDDVQIPNRLTPLFSFDSVGAGGLPKSATHVYTTVPQMALSFLLSQQSGRDFDTIGSPTPGYQLFPSFCETPTPDCMTVTGATRPRASVYVFTTDKPPLAPPIAHPPLTPLYRMRYESDYIDSCPSPDDEPESISRDYAFATSVPEVETFLSGIVLGGVTYNYKLDGIEGYVYDDCNAVGVECPAGVVALHRLYNAAKHDMVLVPPGEVTSYVNLGYAPVTAIPEIAGYAFPNVDSDLDMVIDGFERIVGTLANQADSDGDGASDFEELVEYDRTDPNPALRGYGVPAPAGAPSSPMALKQGRPSGGHHRYPECGSRSTSCSSPWPRALRRLRPPFLSPRKQTTTARAVRTTARCGRPSWLRTPRRALTASTYRQARTSSPS